MPYGPLPDGQALPKPSKSRKSTGRVSSSPRGRRQQKQPRQRRSAPSPPSRRPTPSPPSPPPQRPTQSGRIQSVTQPKPKPKPKPPGIKEWLAGDEVYQQSQRASQRTLQDFLSELTRRRGESKTSFTQAQEQMERDRERQLAELRDEFASRGLIHSGIYGREQGEFQEQFQTQAEQLEQSQQQLLADILAQETNFRREQELAREMARQEALQRRAARFDLGI